MCGVLTTIVTSKYTLSMLILTAVDKHDIQTISSNEVLNNCFTMYIKTLPCSSHPPHTTATSICTSAENHNQDLLCYLHGAVFLNYLHFLLCSQNSHTDQGSVQNKSSPHTLSHNISLTLRSLMLYIYGAPILDVSRSHTTTQHSR